MNLCGYMTVGKGDREGSWAGSPPPGGHWLAGGKGWSVNKNNSYVTISNGA